mgnify:CR=1 FL=1
MSNLTKNQEAYQALLKKYAKALIAEMCGISRQSITKWKTVPSSRVRQLAEATGLRPEEIRPEPYAND